MSEDIDMILPGVPTRYKSTNSSQINPIVRSMQAISSVVGFEVATFDGQRSERGAHGIWELSYASEFLPKHSAVISMELSIRPRLVGARKAQLRQLLRTELVSGYENAFCWALDFGEVRAEKVRAAFTREQPQIRDFYDLGLLARLRVDMNSDEFRELVDAKLDEVNARPLAEQPASFGLDTHKRKAVESSRSLLEAVLRADEPRFELEPILNYYNELWGKVD